MSPVAPQWHQPSHPQIQQVIKSRPPATEPSEDKDVQEPSTEDFSTKSISKVSLPPFSEFAKLTFPPCTITEEPSYSTLQIGKDKHILLNSDLLYINHSCEPSLVSES